jgi:hypothetical protein
MASGFRATPELRLDHSGKALVACFHLAAGAEVGGYNGTESGKKGVPPAGPLERPEPQVGQPGAGHPCPMNYNW